MTQQYNTYQRLSAIVGQDFAPLVEGRDSDTPELDALSDLRDQDRITAEQYTDAITVILEKEGM